MPITNNFHGTVETIQQMAGRRDCDALTPAPAA